MASSGFIYLLILRAGQDAAPKFPLSVAPPLTLFTLSPLQASKHTLPGSDKDATYTPA